MKPTLFIAVFGTLLSLAGAAKAQSNPAYEIIERGPNHRVIRTVSLERDENGVEREEIGSYVELQPGMHYWAESQWKESDPTIELFPGGAVARRVQQKIIFSPNLNVEGAILEGPDGSRLRSTPLALVYFDTVTGQQVTLASLQDTVGELIGDHQILYRNAYDKIHADILYTVRKTGLEQDIILKEQPVAPEQLGLSDLTRLEVATEFYAPPEPRKRETVLAAVQGDNLRAQMAEPDFIDEELNFNDLLIGQGRAFWQDQIPGERPEQGESDVPVGKRWIRDDTGRTVLFESVEFEAIKAYLEKLPEAPVEGARLNP